MTIFDRYLLRRFLHSFAILFFTTYGLYVVIDGFTNIDGFLEGQEDSSKGLKQMVVYYLYQSTVFFNLIAPTLSVITVIVVVALLQKNSEFHPILAAGIPTYRLTWPIVAGVLVVTGGMFVNQEIVIPRIARQLQTPRNKQKERTIPVEPLYDRTSWIHIDGKGLLIHEQTITEAEFLLPTDLATDLTTLNAATARYVAAEGERPAGWLLAAPDPALETIALTEAGRKLVLSASGGKDAFIVTDVSFDQLNNRTKFYQYLPAGQLLKRIQNPATGFAPLKAQAVHFHNRFLKPLLCVIAVFIVVPLVLRKESRSLIGNMAICAGVMSALYGLAQLFWYMGEVNLIAADLAVWTPIIMCGSTAGWLTGSVQM